MYLGRILCPIVTLGPGKRLVIWTKGCRKKCKGCISPELAEIGNVKSIPVQDIVTIVTNIYRQEGFEGITISGGDPFEQMDELLELLQAFRNITDDILVYTGFVWDELKKDLPTDKRRKIESLISVLIDGPYLEELNTKDVTLRGSSNQKIIFFDETKRDLYDTYISEGRKLQNVYMGDKIITVGIMDK